MPSRSVAAENHDAHSPSISRPGSLLPIARGSQPTAVANAVIKMGDRRSETPRTEVSRPHDCRSLSTICS